jgi:hypothetical protein
VSHHINALYCIAPVKCKGVDVNLLLQDRVCTFAPVDIVKSLWVPYTVLRSGGEGCDGHQLHKEHSLQSFTS